MQKPKMILFDYGHTLIYGPEFVPMRGTEELMKHIRKNPYGHTLEDIRNLTEKLWTDHFETVRRLGYEASVQTSDRIVFESLGIELDLTPLEAEIVFWNAASPGFLMPGADRMIEYLNRTGIRSGVISNLIFSGGALKDRIDRFLPGHRFEFILSSCDYFFRKPHPYMFHVAIAKAGLSPSEIWYCGDNPAFDAAGAHGAGIFPVWFDSDVDKKTEKQAPECEHLHIREWNELTDLLDRL